jgi:hypothetical protein
MRVLEVAEGDGELVMMVETTADGAWSAVQRPSSGPLDTGGA